MGAPKKADWWEERRKRAWQLKAQNWQQKDIAAALGVSARSRESLAQTRHHSQLFKAMWLLALVPYHNRVSSCDPIHLVDYLILIDQLGRKKLLYLLLLILLSACDE